MDKAKKVKFTVKRYLNTFAHLFFRFCRIYY